MVSAVIDTYRPATIPNCPVSIEWMEFSRLFPNRLWRRRKVIACGVSALFISAFVLLVLKPQVQISNLEFDWSKENGYRKICVTRPDHGRLLNSLIARQSRELIADDFTNAGWTIAQGRVNVQVLWYVYVLRIDGGDAPGVEIIDPRRTDVMIAIDEGNQRSALSLISAGAGLNAKDQRGWTPLMHAAIQGDANTTRALLRAGADPNATDRVNRTALIWAARKCTLEVASLLTKAGADLGIRDNFGLDAAAQSPCLGEFQEATRKR
jgi:hypothetical protein